MFVLVALVVPCGLLGLMMAMQRVQERMLPSVAPVVPVTTPDAAPPAALIAAPVSAEDIDADTEPMPVIALVPIPVPAATDTLLAALIPAQVVPTYESSDSEVGSTSLTSASPSR